MASLQEFKNLIAGMFEDIKPENVKQYTAINKALDELEAESIKKDEIISQKEKNEKELLDAYKELVKHQAYSGKPTVDTSNSRSFQDRFTEALNKAFEKK